MRMTAGSDRFLHYATLYTTGYNRRKKWVYYEHYAKIVKQTPFCIGFYLTKLRKSIIL